MRRLATALLVALAVGGCTDGEGGAVVETTAPTAASVTPSSTTPPATTTTSPHGPTLEELVLSHPLSDGGAIILSVDGQVVARGSDGDGTDVSPEVPFEAASVVKMTVAVGVLQLVDDGLVDLDAPVADYVDFEVAETITVRHVLSHTSGIGDLTGQFSVCPTLDTLERMREKAGASSGPTPEMEYSNANYLLAGELIWQVVERDVGAHLAAKVFRPAGMASTYFWETQDGPDPYWPRPVDDPGAVSPFTCTELLPATVGTDGRTFVTTAPDLHLFMKSLFGGDLLSDAMLDEMLPDLVDGEPTPGLGIWLETNDDYPGTVLYGHYGARIGSAYAYHDPERGVTVTGYEYGTPDGIEQLVWEAAHLPKGQEIAASADDGSSLTLVSEPMAWGGGDLAVAGGSDGQFVVVASQGGSAWTPVSGSAHAHRPAISVHEGGVLAVSPGTGGFSGACASAVMTASFTEDGREWVTAQSTDWGPVGEPNPESPHRQQCFQFGRGQGGEAVGSVGILIVRHLTRCCVDPAHYPHFWFSVEGKAWERVDLPDRIDTHDSPDSCGTLVDIGAPMATEDGFEIELEFANDNGWCATELWRSENGLDWTLDSA